MLKNWCFRTVGLEKTLESPLDFKEMQQVNPKGNQSWIFFGRTETEAPILWPPDAKSQLIGKDPDGGKDWRQEEKATTDEMVGWHHQLNKQKFEQAPGDGETMGLQRVEHNWVTEQQSNSKSVKILYVGIAFKMNYLSKFLRSNSCLLRIWITLYSL